MAEIEVGSKVWIFVGPRRMTQHNLRIGTFTSAITFDRGTDELLPLLPNPDAGSLSPFILTISARYMVEYNLEMYRRAAFPGKPSRFSGVFAFDEISEAEKAMNEHRWDPALVRTARVTMLFASHSGDMEIITHLRHLAVDSMTDPTPFMQAYWNGDRCPAYELQKVWSAEWEQFNPEPIWESLIEGAITFDEE